MTENVENLLLEHMKRMQTEMVAARQRDAEVLTRSIQIETVLAPLVRDQADAFTSRVDDRHALGALKERVERVERRLEMISWIFDRMHARTSTIRAFR